MAALVGAAAFSTAVAMGPMAGPATAPMSGRPVPPESCMSCERTADWRSCHQTALSLAMEREWPRAIAVEESVHRMQPRNAEVVNQNLAELDKQLDYLEGRIGSPWAAGEFFTLADCALAPSVGTSARSHPRSGRVTPSRSDRSSGRGSSGCSNDRQSSVRSKTRGSFR